MNKVFRIVVTLSFLAGFILFFIGLAGIKFDFNYILDMKETETYNYNYELSSVKSIDLDIPYGKVSLFSKEDVDDIQVTIVTRNHDHCSVDLEKELLTIKEKKFHISSRWYDMFDKYRDESRLEIVYPVDSNFDKVNLHLSAGLLEVKDLHFNELTARVSAGEVKFSNCYGPHLSLINSAGKTTIEESIIEKINMNVSAGEVILNKIGFDCLDFDLSAGNIVCNTLGKKEEYSINVSVSAGSCNVTNQNVEGTKYIKGRVSAGNASFSFGS